MASLRRSLGERIYRWKLLVSNVWEHLSEVPHLEKDLLELDRIAKEVQALSVEQARLQAETQQVTANIRTLARQGDRIRGRVGAALKGYYGFDAPRLISFGFTPRRSKSMEEETERRDRGKVAVSGRRSKPSTSVGFGLVVLQDRLKALDEPSAVGIGGGIALVDEVPDLPEGGDDVLVEILVFRVPDQPAWESAVLSIVEKVWACVPGRTAARLRSTSQTHRYADSASTRSRLRLSSVLRRLGKQLYGTSLPDIEPVFGPVR